MPAVSPGPCLGFGIGSSDLWPLVAPAWRPSPSLMAYGPVDPAALPPLDESGLADFRVSYAHARMGLRDNEKVKRARFRTRAPVTDWLTRPSRSARDGLCCPVSPDEHASFRMSKSLMTQSDSRSLRTATLNFGSACCIQKLFTKRRPSTEAARSPGSQRVRPKHLW